MGVNHVEFRSWGRIIFSSDEKEDNAAKEVLKRKRGAYRNIFNELILQSPTNLDVNNVAPGRFRASWRPSLGTPDTTSEPEGKPHYRVPGAELIEPVLARMDLKKAGWITNNVPYARRLAFGWSKQAPSGWIRRIVARAGKKFGL